MGKAFLIFILILQYTIAEEDIIKKCDSCHETTAPPLSLIYRRYLVLYSSKANIERRMVGFLASPSKKRSSMPEGMKNRFNPQKHPQFASSIAKQAVKTLIRREDIIPKIVAPKQ